MKMKSVALAVALVAVAGIAMAQTGPIRPAYQYPSASSGAVGPASVQVGSSPLYVAPWASAAFGNDSNLNQSRNNAIDSAYQVYGAGIKADARDANSVFQMGLLVSSGRYSDSGADDYTDSSARSSYDFAFSPRSFLRASWDYLRGHDPRGSTDRATGSAPDKYFLNTPGITYAYGAPGAEGRMEVFASRSVRRYLNNREFTAGSDRDTKDYGAAYYWRVMPKTSILAEARGTDLHYLLPTSTLSGSEARYYVGATWEATAATSGTVKVGQIEKRFQSDRPTFKGTGWEGMITWLPRSYSKFDLYSSRQPLESTGLGNFILSDAIGIIWTHGWNSVFSTEANARFQKDKYQGFDRNDDVTALGLRANYKFRRWLMLGAEYQHTNRDSNVQFYEYDRNLWLLSAALSM